VIDLHTHVLPGLDDGAETIEESRAIARAAAADGVAAIAATPHVRADYPTTAAAMESALATVRADFAREGVPVEVLPGGEVALDMLDRLDGEALRRFTLAQSGVYLLVEFPYYGWPLALEHQLFTLKSAGLTPVLAHPERNRDVQSAPDRIVELARLGTAVQITAGSLDGRLGRSSRATAIRLLELGLVDVLASDAHAPAIREAGVRAAVEVLGDHALARQLTEEAPRAIVDGEPLPVRRTYRRRRRRFFV
jgi:protein-tyrosine phosphatase